jgi:two-component sensor histidine kinase
MSAAAGTSVSEPSRLGRHAGRAAQMLHRGAGRASSSPSDAALRQARRHIVRLAIWIGFASTLAIAVATLMPHPENAYTNDAAVYALTAAAACGNGVFGILALRWWEQRREAPLLLVWGAALVGLVSTLTYFGGGYSSDYYLLFFLVISFVAATQEPAAQALLFVLLVAAYGAAVWAVPIHPFPGNVLLRLGILAGAETLGWYLAAALREEAMGRALIQAEADLKNVLAVEANHRIKNNLQLVADLLSYEAAKPLATLDAVVDITLARVQAVAAVHALLSASDNGQIRTGVVLERVLTLLTERIGAGMHIEARVEGSCPDLDPQRGTWLAIAVNELATNAIVHGFLGGGGRLTLRLEDAVDCRVVVEDDGVGCAGYVEGLGLSLVRRLVTEGLHGEFRLTSDGAGTKAEIVFPAAAELRGAPGPAK